MNTYTIFLQSSFMITYNRVLEYVECKKKRIVDYSCRLLYELLQLSIIKESAKIYACHFDRRKRYLQLIFVKNR